MCYHNGGTSRKTPVASAYRSSVGRPKKFSQLWNADMKRIYITEGTPQDFRCLKKAKGMDSDDAVLHYLLEGYRPSERLDSSNVLLPNLMPTLSPTPVSGRTSGRGPFPGFDSSDAIV